MHWSVAMTFFFFNLFGLSLGHPNHLEFIRVELICILVDIFIRLRKREISWYLFPSLFSKKKNLRVLAFPSNSQIRTYKSDLTLNKDAEFNQNLFSTKLGARSLYKFIMIIKLPIRCLGCAAHQLQCTLTKLGHRINLNLFVVCKHQALPSRGGLELD